MAKKDTTELLKLRDASGEAKERFDNFIILLTRGNDGAEFVREQLKPLIEAEKKLALYEDSHKGIVAYEKAKKDKVRYSNPYYNLIWPHSMMSPLDKLEPRTKLKINTIKKYKKTKK